MCEIIEIQNFDENIFKNIENIGKLSLPIYYDSSNLEHMKTKKLYTIYIAKEFNKILGFIITAITNDDCIHVMSIAIDPSHRNKKIGTSLLDKIKKINNDKIITLYVQSNNYRAINFYEKNKFFKIYTENDYYTNLDNNEAIFMAYME